MKSKKPTVVDLFSGLGGFHMGFENQGFDVLLAIDNNPDVKNTHIVNFPEIPFIWKNIENVSNEEIDKILKGKKVDVIIGGPPCQGFSMIGKRNLDDPRNKLFKEFLRIVNHLKPKYFVMENVKGLTTMDNGNVMKKIIDEFTKIGYKDIDKQILNAADYGVPQLRERVIFIGNCVGKKISFPKPTHSEKKNGKMKSYETVGKVISSIPKNSKNHVPMKHNPVVKERISHIPEGEKLPYENLPSHLKFGSRSDFKKTQVKNFANVFRRLHRKKPSVTMVPGHNAFPIHPTEDRSLTVREAARIQTIPDTVEITGSRQNQCIQVGNAVPVLLAEAIAKVIKKELSKTI